jgi:N-acetylmuramoyl-L-alanine amidase CwlA
MEINRSYLCNADNYQRGRAQPVSYLVIHYVGASGGARDNARYYQRTPGAGASAHYFVGHASEGAAVYASVPEGDTAWHCGRKDGKYKHPQCRNANSIGIEICCHQDAGGSWYFDPETVDAAVELARDIMARYGIPIDHVLRHYDVTGKVCPAPYVNDPAAWDGFLARLDGREEEKSMTVYHWFADMPDWARQSAEKAYQKGILSADATGAVSVYEVNLQALVWMDRLGLLE